MKSIIVAVVIFVFGALVISCYLADQKVKRSASQIAILNDLIKEKDAGLNKLMGEMQSKQQELDNAKRELENVKTELSNTVLRLQASAPGMAPSTKAPAKVPAKAPVVKK